MDTRCNSVADAVEWATRANLLGIVCKATPFVYAPEIIAKIKVPAGFAVAVWENRKDTDLVLRQAAGLLLATWGRENNGPAFVQLQKNRGVDAIIADHVQHIHAHGGPFAVNQPL